MNPLQIALVAAQIAGTLWPMVEPLAAKGLDAFIAELKTKLPHAKAVSMADIKTMADKHGVDMAKVLDFAEPAIMGMANAHKTLPAGHMGLSFSSFFSGLGSAFTSFRNWLADPQTTQAVQNVAMVLEAVICEIGPIAGLTAELMQQVGSGQSALGTTNKINVATTTICTAMKGTVVGTASNVSALTAPLT